MTSVRRRSGALATVRTRTTLVTIGVVGVVLAITGVVLVVALRDSLTDGVRTAIELRATDLTETLERGVPPEDLVIEEEDDQIVQVFDRAGSRRAGESTIRDGTDRRLAATGRFGDRRGRAPRGGALEGPHLHRGSRPRRWRAVPRARRAQPRAGRRLDRSRDHAAAHRLPAAPGDRGSNCVVAGGPCARAGGVDPFRGRRDLGSRAAPPCAGAERRRRDRAPCPHDERDAHPTRRGADASAPVRVRCLPRAAQPGDDDPPACRGRAGTPGGHLDRRARGHGARRGPPPRAARRRPALARACRRAPGSTCPGAGRPRRPRARGGDPPARELPRRRRHGRGLGRAGGRRPRAAPPHAAQPR